MASSKVLVLLLGLAAVSSIHAAGETAPSTTLFADWLSAKHKPSKAAVAYYAEAEVQDVCMREHSVQGCSCYGRNDKSCCWAFNIEAEMTCCNKPEEHKGLDKMTEDIITTGKCTYTPMLLEKPVMINEYDDTVVKIGTFTGSCTMNKDSSTCGDPACEGMSVTIQGEIMRANKVAFEGKPIHAHKTEGCAKVFHGDCAAGNKVSIAASDLRSSGLLGTPSQYKHDTYAKTKYEEPKYKPHYEEKHYEEKQYEDKHEDRHYDEHRHYEEPKHYEEKPKYYEEPEEKYEERSYDGKRKYYSGSGMVFMGTFYTVNRLHDTKHFSGVYQSVHVMDVKDEPMESAPEGSYVARGNEVYFRFIKGGAAEPLKA